jgi:hypothetical protein
MRSLWQSDPERMLPGHDGSSNVVYDESGTIYCYDKVSEPPVRHKMAYIGYEPERETLKYRCPAKHEGWECPMSKDCNAGKSYGKTVRVDREVDLRRLPSLPRATKKFERMYKGRTSVERVNARLITSRRDFIAAMRSSRASVICGPAMFRVRRFVRPTSLANPASVHPFEPMPRSVRPVRLDRAARPASV